MANTVIQLKKSSTPASVPASLANGELALNFADGVLYYKAANGSIAAISGSGGGGLNYGIVNANGTLVIADSSGATFAILPGDFITVTGDAINDRVTIGANVKVVYDTANAAFNYANGLSVGSAAAAFDAANQAGVFANTAYDKANAANVLAYNTGIGANNYAGVMANAANGYASTIVAANLDTARAYTNTSTTAANNYAGVMANSANAYAASLTPDLSPAFNKANSAYLVANAAFDKANNSGVNVSTTGPTNNTNGTLWFNSNLGRLFVYYTDQDSSQWIEASPSSGTIDTGLIQSYVNVVSDLASFAYNTANGAFVKSNSISINTTAAFAAANQAGVVANTVYNFANGIATNTTAAFEFANGIATNTTAVFNFANGVSINATASFDRTNSVFTLTNASYTISNASFNIANAAFDRTNTVYLLTNNAFTTANAAIASAANAVSAVSNRLSNTSFTLAGTLTTTGAVIDSKGDTRDIPPTDVTASMPYVITLADTGKMVVVNGNTASVANVFIPNTVFSIGQTIMITNQSTSNVTVTQNSSVTMFLAGNAAATGNRTLAGKGIATIMCVGANNFIISGAGLT